MQFSKSVIAILLAMTIAAYDKGSSRDSKSICSSSIEIRSQNDADVIAHCKQFNGDIIVETSESSFALSGIEHVQGSVILHNLTRLNTFSAPSLISISGSLELIVLNALTGLSLPNLKTVNILKCITLPNLNNIDLANGITRISTVMFSDTGLTQLPNLNVLSLDVLNLNNNRYLTQVSSAIQYIRATLEISANGLKTQVHLPELIWARNISFRSCDTVNLPKLSYVNASLGFIENPVKNLTLPMLLSVGETLSFTSNNQLEVLQAPKLSVVSGGFIIVNNSGLMQVNGFPSVKRVDGAVQMYGHFSQAILPAVEQVKGGVEIGSDNKSFNCTFWDDLNSNRAILGDTYYCSTTDNKPISPTTTSKVNETSKAGKKGVASSLHSTELITGLSVIVAMLLHLL